MELAARITKIKPSATLAVNAKAQEMRAQGREVVSLAVGEPDFATPEHVTEAMKKALDQGYTRYTAVPGLPEVREAVAGYFNRHYQAGAESEQVMVSNGGKQCLFNLLQVLLDPGDEVLIPAPYWVSYPDMTALAGGNPVIVPASAENGFELTIDELEKKVSSGTKILILNSPSNPTGQVYSRHKLEEIFDWAVSRDIFVISDEIYDRLVYPPAEPASLSRIWDRAEENLAVVNGLSKSFATTGLRAGFVLAGEHIIKAMSKLQGQSTSNVCSPVQKGMQAALEGGEEFVERMRESLGKRRDMAMQKIKDWPGSVCVQPQGAFYLFPRLDACPSAGWPGSVSICERILEETGVAVVPGEAFGDDTCLRISYAVDENTLEKALDAVGKVVCG
jgi:aspartate aminotransferase